MTSVLRTYDRDKDIARVKAEVERNGYAMFSAKGTGAWVLVSHVDEETKIPFAPPEMIAACDYMICCYPQLQPKALGWWAGKTHIIYYSDYIAYYEE